MEVISYIALERSLLKYKSYNELLSECNETRTNNHLVRKRILNHLANLVS